jgi:chemotaxis protein CheD
LVTVGLGSCVAIALHDALARIGGLAHVLLPQVIGQGEPNRAKFASTAVPLLIEDMRALGASGPFVAKLAGGASLFGPLMAIGGTVGARNIEAARAALEHARVPVIGEDVGGVAGRTVILDVATGTLLVTTVRGGERAI